MGRHKEWRKEAKKMRRKRIRQATAQSIEAKANAEQEAMEDSPRFQALVSEQYALELFEREEEARQELIRHTLWLKNEEIAQQQFIQRQERLKLAREERIKQDKLIRKEWEAEQAKLKVIAEEKQRVEDEKKRKQDELLQQIDDFVRKGGELPQSANISTETNPDRDPCPFFSKTGACRFGDRCSRNHKRPGISKVLLVPSFYSHFGMSQSMAVEYDTDLMLEYEDSETYQHFKDFYDDVLPEFEEYGDVVQFKVCCNGEPHLRGNVYVEFSSERYAVAAYQKFHGRYYGGRQLNIEFACIASWKAALCGMFFKKRCPKGRNCNFLHVFRNPDARFNRADRDLHLGRDESARHSSRSPSRCSFSSPQPSRSRSHRGHEDRSHWRWSESPPSSRDEERDTETSSRRNNREKKSSKSDKEKENASSRPHKAREDSSSRRSKREESRRSEKSSECDGRKSERRRRSSTDKSSRSYSSKTSERRERRQKYD